MSDTLLDLTTGRMQPKQIAGQLFASASGFGAVRVAQVESEGLEMTRAGRRWYLGQNTGAVTGQAPVQAVPTTTAQWVLWNASTTDSYIFDQLGVMLVSGTAGAGITVWGAYLTAPAQTGFTANLAVVSANNSANRVSTMAVKSNVTITAPAAPTWFPICKSDTTNTAVLSVAAQLTDIKGRLLVQPLQGLALAVLSPAGTSPLYVPIASWFEAAMDNE